MYIYIYIYISKSKRPPPAAVPNMCDEFCFKRDARYAQRHYMYRYACV